MARNFTADDDSGWFDVVGDGGVHFAAANDFGGGTVHIEKQVNGTAYAALDSTGAAITKVAAFDAVIEFGVGDKVRLRLAGSSSPDLDWEINGPVRKVPVLGADGWEVD